MTDYLLDHGSRRTPQSEPMRPDQVPNSAGGYAWLVEESMRLNRFLILGTEGGSYYAGERELTAEATKLVRELAAKDGETVLATVVAISQSGRAPTNDPALYALAAVISHGSPAAKRAAAEALPLVARTGTHLFHFVAYAQTMRGWGRTLRRAVAAWYESKPVEDVAYQAVKYRQRDGWTHRDLLRLSHPRVEERLDADAESERLSLFDWIAGRQWKGVDTPIVDAFLEVQESPDAKQTANLVRHYPDLPREALKPEHLDEPDVWRALLETRMPLTAMIRNLATMTRLGVLRDSEARRRVEEALDNHEAIRGARVHPMTLLVALRTYAAGQGLRGGNTWMPIPDVVDALDAAFYLAFDNVEPTGKSHLLALDVSGSMATGMVAGSPLTPREASVAMALVTLHAERDVEVVGFSNGLTPLPLSRRQRLDDAVASVSGLPFQATDCALPMLYATEANYDVDAFVIYTDSETWYGNVHPKQALAEYRATGRPNARAAVVGMVANRFTIADPADPGMLDFVGFDTATPEAIAAFVRGDA